MKTNDVFFIHSSTEGHLGYFQFLTTMNTTEKNMAEKVSLW